RRRTDRRQRPVRQRQALTGGRRLPRAARLSRAAAADARGDRRLEAGPGQDDRPVPCHLLKATLLADAPPAFRGEAPARRYECWESRSESGPPTPLRCWAWSGTAGACVLKKEVHR